MFLHVVRQCDCLVLCCQTIELFGLVLSHNVVVWFCVVIPWNCLVWPTRGPLVGEGLWGVVIPWNCLV